MRGEVREGRPLPWPLGHTSFRVGIAPQWEPPVRKGWRGLLGSGVGEGRGGSFQGFPHQPENVFLLRGGGPLTLLDRF